MNSNQLRIACVVVASMAGGVALAEDGVTDKTIVFGQVAALIRSGPGFGPGHAPGNFGGLRGRQSRRRSFGPHAGAQIPRRRLRAGKDRRGDQGQSRRRQGVRAHRRGRHADVEGEPADRHRGESAVHRPVHRRRIFAQSVQPLRRQRAQLLFRGDRSLDRAPDQGSGHLEDRHPLPGRRLRSRRPRRRAAGDGEAQHDARRIRLVQAQHGRGEIGAARYHESGAAKRW